MNLARKILSLWFFKHDPEAEELLRSLFLANTRKSGSPRRLKPRPPLPDLTAAFESVRAGRVSPVPASVFEDS